MTLQWVFRWRGFGWGMTRPVARPTAAHSERVSLASGQVISRELRAGTQVRCEAGVLWLTLPGDTRDYVLKAGQSLTLPRSGKVVVQGMEEVELRILGS
jgi:hypothetical protein